MKIISRNYLNRNSAYKWLVRDQNEPKEKAVACKAVKAGNIEFKASNEWESGFGCSTVAWAEDAEIIDPELKATDKTELKFNGQSFETSDGRHVRKARALELTPEGKMLAAL